MAITSIEYLLLGRLRQQDLLSLGADILELGEANWYGDVPLDQFSQHLDQFADPADHPRLRAEFDHLYAALKSKQAAGEDTTDDTFAMAKVFWQAFLKPASMTHVDLNGTDASLKADLNKPLDLGRQFGMVTNIGTAEHVFNIAQVFETVHDHCLPGGLMFHVMPFSGWIDHGFYSVQPTFYWDLAAANGYVIRCLQLAELSPPKFLDVRSREAIAELARADRLAENTVIAVVYEKGDGNGPFQVPMQGYYAGTLSDSSKAAWYDFR